MSNQQRKIARGERNNNPGNIRHGSKWQGLSSTQTDKDFCQFISPEYGIRAIFVLMRTYEKKYGLCSVRQIINRYAPPNENNTEGYIQRAAKTLGVSPEDCLTVNDKEVAIQLSKAIIAIELGYAVPYSDSVFEKAWSLL
ncbi:structural protein [Providencia huaxiensis]|uniref:structural protein n=1 Tax=Providencia TaxID=586 RepID=UPI0023497DD4|nr:structural protein [Providencia sp. PROV152]ELR5106988.1 structural protein [Providencia rettgeri]ELR5125467.1 structural protein [Providencia rettgeri]ELR5198715.1 structural protein [Providencia rettgeri]ELR5282761.1 structural protein [Providencia rettgeri]ELS4583658.1 structural protein [Providencia rettgeri]